MAKDYVNHPSHYRWGSKECIDVIEENLTREEYAGYLKGTQIKYVYRHEHKWDAVEDLQKALWYIDRYRRRFAHPKQLDVTELEDAYSYEFANLDDQPTEKLIAEFIDAVKQNNPAVCKLLIMHLETQAKKHRSQFAKTPHEFDGEDEMSSTAVVNSPVIPENQGALIDPRDLSTNAKRILSGFKFLEAWNIGLWENAYSFNYDNTTNTLTIQTILNDDVIDIDDDFVPYRLSDTDHTPLEIKLVYEKPANWSMHIETLK